MREILLTFAWEMLRSKRKQLSISAGVVALSVFLIIYELTTFHRVMARVYSVVKEMNDVDIWVVDPMGHSLQGATSSQGDRGGQGVFDRLRKVRALAEVEAAAPFSTGMVAIRLPGGKVLECLLLGIDEASYLGSPKVMKRGKISNLSYDNGIVIDEASSRTLFTGKQLRIGEYTGTIVGIAASSKKTYPSPLIYTTIERAAQITNHSVKESPFILVKGKEGVNLPFLCKKIEEITHLKAFTKRDFSYLVLSSYLKDHQVPYHFTWIVLLGVILTLGILSGSIASAIDLFQKEIQIFKAIGATKSSIRAILLVIGGGIAIAGWMLGVLLYFLFYGMFSSFGSIFPISWEAFYLSFGVIIFLTSLIACSKSFCVKEICKEGSW